MDDKREELAALKRRVAELEAADSPRPKPAKSKPGAVATIVVLGGFCAVAMVLLGQLEPDKAPPKLATPEPATCDKDWATAHFTAARALGIVRDMDVSRARGMVVIVNPARWEAQSIDAQKVLAATIDCGVASPDYLKEIHFRRTLDGEDLMKVEAIELLQLRRDGYAKSTVVSGASASSPAER